MNKTIYDQKRKPKCRENVHVGARSVADSGAVSRIYSFADPNPESNKIFTAFHHWQTAQNQSWSLETDPSLSTLNPPNYPLLCTLTRELFSRSRSTTLIMIDTRTLRWYRGGLTEPRKACQCCPYLVASRRGRSNTGREEAWKICVKGDKSGVQLVSLPGTSHFSLKARNVTNLPISFLSYQDLR